MSALNPLAVISHYGNLYVGTSEGTAVHIGAVRNLKFNARASTQEIESDNLAVIVSKGRLNGSFSCDWLEPGNPNYLEILFKGLVTKTTVAGTLVTGAVVAKTSGNWAYNVPFELDGQNGAGTAQTITSVVASVNGALTANVDYVQVQLPSGRWGIQVIDSTLVSTLSQTITVTYSYTPAASTILTGGLVQTGTPIYVRIEAPKEEGSSLKRIFKASSCNARSDFLLEFLNPDRSNDVAVMPLTLDVQNGTTWTYEDQVNP